jgi:hypothetical protein
MPAARRAKLVESASARKGSPAAANTAARSRPMRSLTPRPMLLTALSVVFALWMAFLIALYFKSMPARPKANSTEPMALGAIHGVHVLTAP